MITINIPVCNIYGKDRMRIINRYKQDNVPSEYVSVVKLSYDECYGALAKYITLYAKHHPELPCICLDIAGSKKYYVPRGTASKFLNKLRSCITAYDGDREVRFM
mgnify:FL=1